MNKTNHEPPRRILSWAEEDRPREKLLIKGKSALSDAELIAILLGSGTAQFSAVDLAKVILGLADNSVKDLSRLSVKDLTKVKGIGDAKAITLIAALELGRRRRDIEPNRRRQVKSSYDVYMEMKGEFADKEHEEMWLLMLNRSHHVIRKIQLSTGGVSGTFVDIKMVFKSALEYLASSVVVIHNHPSGSAKPSESDLVITKKLVSTGAVMDIPVVDHLILAEGGYFSFKDEGII